MLLITFKIEPLVPFSLPIVLPIIHIRESVLVKQDFIGINLSVWPTIVFQWIKIYNFVQLVNLDLHFLQGPVLCLIAQLPMHQLDYVLPVIRNLN
jgi:hypothetical protein